MSKDWITIVLVTILFNATAFSRERVATRKLPKDFKIIVDIRGRVVYWGKLLDISFIKGGIIVGTSKLAEVGDVDTILSINEKDTVLNVIKISKPNFEIRFNISHHHQSIGIFLSSNPPKEISVHLSGLKEREDSLTKVELIEAIFCHIKEGDSLFRQQYKVNNSNVNTVFDTIRKTSRPCDVIFANHIVILINGELYKEDGDYFGYLLK